MLPILDKWSSKIQAATLQVGSKGSKFLQSTQNGGQSSITEVIQAGISSRVSTRTPKAVVCEISDHGTNRKRATKAYLNLKKHLTDPYCAKSSSLDQVKHHPIYRISDAKRKRKEKLNEAGPRDVNYDIRSMKRLRISSFPSHSVGVGMMNRLMSFSVVCSVGLG